MMMTPSELKSRGKKASVVTADDLENQEDVMTEKERLEKKFNLSPKWTQRTAPLIVVYVIAAVIVLLTLYLIFYPSPISPVALQGPDDPLPYFTGAMRPNKVLQKVEKVGTGKLNGPDSFQIDRDGNLYTGLADGRIVKIMSGTEEIVELGRTGQKLPECGDPEYEHLCGRPLGIHFDHEEKNLIICDALGLLKFDIKTGQVTTLMSAEEGIDGHPFKFLNHIAVTYHGQVVFTDSSWKWSRKDWSYLALEGGGQGRLLSYDLKSGDAETLLTGLFFPNGVALSPNEDAVIVTETSHARMLRYFLHGPRKGIYDIFQDNLPGIPDNIRATTTGGYWVAMPSVRKWPASLLDLVGPYPAVKNALAKLLPKKIFSNLMRSYGLIVKMDYYGDILASYHDPDGSVITHISEAIEDYQNGILYLGSFKNDFIGKIKISDLPKNEEL